MAAISRHRAVAGPTLFSAGFRPFFLGAAIWAAAAVPIWLAAYAEGLILPTRLSPVIWHAHEMIFGFAAAVVAGFLLTAIPNWTGRMPLQGTPLAMLVLLWAVGRIAILVSARIGAPAAAVADLAFPAAFVAVVAREITAGRNWRNLPMVAALSLLLIGNLLVHLEALGLADAGELGNRLGLATLFMLISLVGGRIVPSFTHNWLAKTQPEAPPPAAPESRFDVAALAVTAVALALWTVVPDGAASHWGLIAAGIAVMLRLVRWRGRHTLREPLLVILHVGYFWLAFGLFLLGVCGLTAILPAAAALHALTVGAIGTMTLAVMTRASLGHTGRPLSAGPVTLAIYALVTLAAVVRVLSPLAGGLVLPALWLSGAAWSGAFGLFAVFYGRALARPRLRGDAAAPI